MSVNANGKIILEGNGAITLNGNKGSSGQALTSRGNGQAVWESKVDKIIAGNGVSVDRQTGQVTIAIPEEPESCTTMGRIHIQAITMRGEGSGNRPAFAYGINVNALSSNKTTYIGLAGSSDSGRFRVTFGADWNESGANCGGSPDGPGVDILSFDLGMKKNGVDKGDVDESRMTCKLNTVPESTDNAEANMRISGQGRVVRLTNPKRALPGTFVTETAATDTDINAFNWETIVDGFHTAATADLTGGTIFSWLKRSSTAVYNEFDSATDKAIPLVDPDVVAAISPLLVNWEWDDQSIEEVDTQDSPDSEIYKTLQFTANPARQPSSVKWDLLTFISLVGLRKTRERVTALETNSATTAYVDQAISDLVDSSPGTLDTLNELAAALGDDANFATTVTDSLALKLDATAFNDLGTFTGATIADNVGVKVALQSLETSLETKLSAETITMTAFKAVVAASSDFADFQTRVAAL